MDIPYLTENGAMYHFVFLTQNYDTLKDKRFLNIVRMDLFPCILT